MVSLKLPLLGAVLALAVAAKDVIRWIPMADDDRSCRFGGKANPQDLQLDQCRDVSMASVVFMADPAWEQWLIEKVNSGGFNCTVAMYKTTGCTGSEPSIQVFPEKMLNCLHPFGNDHIRSMKLSCPEISKSYVYVETITFWDIDSQHHLVPHTTTETYQITGSLRRRAEATPAPISLRDEQYNKKWIIRKHPLTFLPTCYKCWMTSPNNPGKWACESGAHADIDMVHCPQAVVPKTPAKIRHGKRSLELKVLLLNPYANSYAPICANWKVHRFGKDKGYIWMEGVHDCTGGEIRI